MGQSRHSRSAKPGCPQRGKTVRTPDAIGSGRARRSARHPLPSIPERRRAGRPAAGATVPTPRASERRARRVVPTQRSAASTTPRMRSIGRRDLWKPAPKRGGALSHKHGATIRRTEPRGSHRPDPGSLASGVDHIESDDSVGQWLLQRKWLPGHEPEWCRIDHDGTAVVRSLCHAQLSHPRRNRSRRSTDLDLAATGTPRMRAAPTAARAPPPVPTISQPPAGASSWSSAAVMPATSVFSPTDSPSFDQKCCKLRAVPPARDTGLPNAPPPPCVER